MTKSFKLDILNLDKRRTTLFLYSSFFALLFQSSFSFAIIVISDQVTNSAGITGLIFALSYIPQVILTLYGGTLADRVSKANWLRVTQSLLSISPLLLIIGIKLDVSSFVVILFISSLWYGTLQSFSNPTRLAMVPEVADKDKAENLMTSVVSVRFATMAIGPLIVGALFEYSSYILTLAFIGLFSFLSGQLVPATRISIFERRSLRENLRDLRVGLNRIRRSKVISQLVAANLVVCFATTGTFSVLIPLHAKHFLGLEGLGRGMLLMPLGLGMMSGSIVSEHVLHFIRRGRLIAVLCPLPPFLFFCISFMDSLFICMLNIVVMGVVAGLTISLATTSLQTSSTEQERGKVMAVNTLVLFGFSGLSGATVGLVAEIFNTTLTIQLSGLFGCILGTFLINPNLSLSRYKVGPTRDF